MDGQLNSIRPEEDLDAIATRLAAEYFAGKQEDVDMVADKLAADYFAAGKPMPVEQAAIPTKKEGLGKTLLREAIDKLGGTAEAVISGASGLGAGMLSVPVGIGKLLSTAGPWLAGKITGVTPPEEAQKPFQTTEEYMGKVQQLGTYVPKTEWGQYLTRVINSPFEAVGFIVDQAAKLMPDKEAQAGIRVGGNLLLNMLIFKYGARLAKGQPILGKEIKATAKEANLPDWMFKDITDEQRYQSSLEEMAKTSGRTPEEIKTWVEERWEPAVKEQPPKEVVPPTPPTPLKTATAIAEETPTGTKFTFEFPKKEEVAPPIETAKPTPKKKVRMFPEIPIDRQNVPVEELTGLAKWKYEEKMGLPHKEKLPPRTRKRVRLSDEEHYANEMFDYYEDKISSGEMKFSEIDPREFEYMKGYFSEPDLARPKEMEAPAEPPSILQPIPTVAKQPWEMTYDEWANNFGIDRKLVNIAARVSDVMRDKNIFRGAINKKPTPGEMRELVSAGLASKESDPMTKGDVFTLTEKGREIAVGHRKSVVSAMREGKTIPPEVLADYPDLVAKVKEPGVETEILPEFTEEMAKAKEKKGVIEPRPMPELNPSQWWKDNMEKAETALNSVLKKMNLPQPEEEVARTMVANYFTADKVTANKGMKLETAIKTYINKIKPGLAGRAKVGIEVPFKPIKTEEGTITGAEERIQAGKKVFEEEAEAIGKKPEEPIPSEEQIRLSKKGEARSDFIDSFFDKQEESITHKDPAIQAKMKAAHKLWRKGVIDNQVADEIGTSRQNIANWEKKWEDEIRAKKEDIKREIDELDKTIDEHDEIPEPGGKIKAGGLAYGMELPKMAQSLNLERVDEGYSLKKFLLDMVDKNEEYYKEKRRGKLSLQEIDDMASALGVSQEELMNRYKQKTKELPEYMDAFRDFTEAIAKEAQRLGREYSKNPNDETLAKFNLHWKRAVSVLGEELGGATEIGRALSARRILSKSREFQATKQYQKILKALGDQAKSEEVARKVAALDINNPLAILKFLRESVKATTRDKIYELWINAILSNPKTHFRNVIGNTLSLALKPVEKGLEAAIEIPLSLARGRTREAYFRQVPAEIAGMLAGVSDGVRAMLYAWRNEVTMAGVSKIEPYRYGAIKGKTGKIVRIPGRALMAADEFFKGILYSSDIFSEATKAALQEVKSGKITKERLAERIAELREKPTSKMAEHATAEALYRTFQNDLGKLGKLAMQAKERSMFVRYIVPFLRTPVNITKYGLERTPLNAIKIVNMFRKGEFKGEAASRELAKLALGTFSTVPVVLGVLNGRMTGSAPENKNERDAFYRQGKLPFAFKVGNIWISYRGDEPVSTIMGTMADFVSVIDRMKDEDVSKVAGQILTSIFENMKSQSFNKGWVDAIDTLLNAERYGNKWLKGFAGSLVPSIVAEVARDIDPNIRQAKSIVDAVKARIPGISKQVPPKKDIYGAPEKKYGTPWLRFFSPQQISREKIDDIEREFNRLKIYPGPPSKKVHGKNLTNEQYDFYSGLSGKNLHALLDELIHADDYKDISDKNKIANIQNRIRLARSMARIELLNRYPTLGEAILEEEEE